jgi:hypothetical protein
LLSSQHFSVDGTLIEAWASPKSFKPKQAPEDGGHPRGGGRNAPADFRGEKRSNKTHRSTTDPDPRLYRKGAGMEAKLCFIGRGLPAHCRAPARDHARRRPGCDAADFVEGLRSTNAGPHIAE